MAISKDQAGQLTSADREAVKKAETVIDGKLDLDFRPDVASWSVSVSYGELKQAGVELNHRVVRELRRLYEASGWTVVDNHDQRDGNFITFS